MRFHGRPAYNHDSNNFTSAAMSHGLVECFLRQTTRELGNQGSPHFLALIPNLILPIQAQIVRGIGGVEWQWGRHE